MVVLTDEDFEQLPLKSTRTVDVLQFVPVEDVDPVSFDRAYLCDASGGDAKPYVLLRDALERTGKAAIVKVALRQRERLAMLRPRDGVLACACCGGRDPTSIGSGRGHQDGAGVPWPSRHDACRANRQASTSMSTGALRGDRGQGCRARSLEVSRSRRTPAGRRLMRHFGAEWKPPRRAAPAGRPQARRQQRGDACQEGGGKEAPARRPPRNRHGQKAASAKKTARRPCPRPPRETVTKTAAGREQDGAQSAEGLSHSRACLRFPYKLSYGRSTPSTRRRADRGAEPSPPGATPSRRCTSTVLADRRPTGPT